MKICVCVNPVPDFGNNCRINNGQPDFENINYSIDMFDMAAYQAALSLKMNHGFKVTLLSVKNKGYEKCLKRLWAMGADRCVWLKVGSDTINNYASVAASFLRTNIHDLILTGTYSSNFSASGFGPLLAEIVGIPSVSDVVGLEYSMEEKLFAIEKRTLDHSIEKYSAPGKFLAAVRSSEDIVSYPTALSMINAENNHIDFIEDITSTAECTDRNCSIYRDPLEDVSGVEAAGTDEEISLKLIKLIEKKELLLK